MELKHLVFILLTIGFIPSAVWVASTFRWAERLLVAGTLFFTTCLIDINVFSMEWYRGDTRGFEISVTDWMIISLMVVMLISPSWKNTRFSFKPPNITLMANDHLLGVGLNNYSHAINETSSSRFIEKEVDRGIVHNIHQLHASETGWIGLIVFVLMTGNFVRLGMQQINKHRDNLASAFAVGISTGTIVHWSRGFLEWVFRQTYITVKFFLLAGFLTALTRVDTDIQKRHYYRNYWRQIWRQKSLSYQS